MEAVKQFGGKIVALEFAVAETQIHLISHRGFLTCVMHHHEVRKKEKTRNRYNQVPHLTKATIWESDKNSRKHHVPESQKVNRRLQGCREHTRQYDKHQTITAKKDPQKKHRLGMVRKKITGWFKHVMYQPHPYFDSY